MGSVDNISWLAGWFEARGHIVVSCREGVNSRSGNTVRSDHFSVGACVPIQVADMLISIYGGKTYGRTSGIHDWRTHGRGAAKFLLDIRPAIRVRRDEFDHALQFWSTMDSDKKRSSVPASVLETRKASAAAFEAARLRRIGYADRRRRAKLLRKASEEV